jgi:hypothetical protein
LEQPSRLVTPRSGHGAPRDSDPRSSLGCRRLGPKVCPARGRIVNISVSCATDDVELKLVRYSWIFALSLSLVVCLDSTSDTSVFMGPGAEPAGPQLSEACRLMTWCQYRKSSCQAKGNSNPGTSFSAIEKKLILFSSCRAGCLKSKHFNFIF